MFDIFLVDKYLNIIHEKVHSCVFLDGLKCKLKCSCMIDYNVYKKIFSKLNLSNYVYTEQYYALVNYIQLLQDKDLDNYIKNTSFSEDCSCSRSYDSEINITDDEENIIESSLFKPIVIDEQKKYNFLNKIDEEIDFLIDELFCYYFN